MGFAQLMALTHLGKLSVIGECGEGLTVSSAFVSYAGATSTISAATKLMPSRPLMMVLNSLVDQPPVSGVPVAGATVCRFKVSLLDFETREVSKQEESLATNNETESREAIHTCGVQSIDVDT